MTALPSAIQITLLTVVVLAAIFDLRSRRIPNWLNLSGIVLGFGLNILAYQAHGMLTSGEGLVAAVAVYLPLYLLRGMGAGDVKLMAAVGALVGPSHWLSILIMTALAGGVCGICYALIKGRFNEICCNLWFLVKDLLHLRAPYRTNPQLDFRNTNALRMPHGMLIAAASSSFLLIELFRPAAILTLLG